MKLPEPNSLELGWLTQSNPWSKTAHRRNSNQLAVILMQLGVAALRLQGWKKTLFEKTHSLK